MLALSADSVGVLAFQRYMGPTTGLTDSAAFVLTRVLDLLLACGLRAFSVLNGCGECDKFHV